MTKFKTPTADSSDTPSGPHPAQVQAMRQRYTFKDMHLQVGDRLQMQGPSHLGTERAFVRVVGYADKVSLMVTPPVINGRRMPLIEGEQLILRTFSGQSAFAFRCTVLRMCKLPFEYVHLSFPDKIQGSVIRKSTRVRTSFPVGVNGMPCDNAIRIDNISATGALLVAPEPVAEQGDTIRITFDVVIHDFSVTLDLEALVLSAMRSESDDPNIPSGVRQGVEFTALTPQDRMMLKSLIYQHLLESPNSVI